VIVVDAGDQARALAAALDAGAARAIGADARA
jgi:hypothetical protein